MRIDIDFDAETTALIEAAAASYNAASGESLTPVQWLARNLAAEWEQRKLEAVRSTTLGVEEFALTLPDASRLAFTADVKALAAQYATGEKP